MVFDPDKIPEADRWKGRTPPTAEERAEKFKRWLASFGATILKPTNEWETVRWTVRGMFGVLYRTKNGGISFNSPYAEEIYQAYSLNQKPFFYKKPKTINPAFKRGLFRQLYERDGDKCVYCGKSFSTANQPTLEHFLSRVHGGNEQLANLALAHEECNNKASSLPIVEKFALIRKLRKEHSDGK